MRRSILPLLCLLTALPARSHDAGHATYLGNAGILVAHGETRILVDAFYSDSYGQYVLVDEATATAMEDGTPPYDGIDAVLVSHVHGDHFSPEPTIAYLRAQPVVELFGSSQVRQAIARAVGEDDPILSRVHVMDVGAEEPPREATIGDVELAVVSVPHSGGARNADIVNLVFRATLDGALTVVHLGDATPEVEHFTARTEHWNGRPLDAAFPPYWFFGSEEGREVLDDVLKARRTIGVHVPEQAVGHGESWRERADADLFTDPGEDRTLEHAEHPPRP